MARDRYHSLVRQALEADGWTVTHDQYFVNVGRRRGYIDLGAERELLGAERDNEKIAVEVKSFLGLSELDQFEDALGHYLIYLVALEKKEPERTLFLAMPEGFFERFFDDPFFSELTARFHVNMIIFQEDQPTIVQWIRY